MTDSLRRFQEALAANPEMQTKVRAVHVEAARTAAEKIAAVAVEQGLPFTAEEFLSAAQTTGDELTEEQLSSVAGGVSGTSSIVLSIFTAGLGCIGAAIESAVEYGRADACIR